MPFINKASVSNNQVQASTSAPLDNYLQGMRYCPDDKLFVNGNTPPGTIPYNQGLRYAVNGALYVHVIEVLGVPANIDYDGGLPTTLLGALVVTNTQPVAKYTNGWPLSQDGYVCMVSAVLPAPSAFTFTVTGGAQNPTPTLNWAASTNATSYDIYRDGVLQTSVGAPTTTWLQSPALPIGDNYNYTMFAVNGTSTVASTSNPRPYSYQSVPGPPTNVSAVAGVLSATVTFSPPLKNGNTGVFGYTATSNAGQFAQGAGPSIVVVGLLAGVNYTFTVTAINSVGTGPPSTPSNSVTPT